MLANLLLTCPPVLCEPKPHLADEDSAIVAVMRQATLKQLESVERQRRDIDFDPVWEMHCDRIGVASTGRASSWRQAFFAKKRELEVRHETKTARLRAMREEETDKKRAKHIVRVSSSVANRRLPGHRSSGKAAPSRAVARVGTVGRVGSARPSSSVKKSLMPARKKRRF